MQKAMCLTPVRMLVSRVHDQLTTVSYNLMLLLFLLLFAGSSVMLNRRIAAELSKRLAKPWTPSFCKKDNISWSGTKPRVWHREVCDKNLKHVLLTSACATENGAKLWK